MPGRSDWHVKNMVLCSPDGNNGPDPQCPEAQHRQLKSRAALAGMSLSDYLLNEIRQAAERPTIDELRARLRSRTETAPSTPPAEAPRAERARN
jgi:antitoxin FitA